MPPLLLLGLVALAGCRSQPLVNPPPLVSPHGAEHNREAILRGMTAHRWVLLTEEPGQITAMQDRNGKHTATVDIVYDDESISIRYLSSHNLRCKPQDDSCSTIHRAYNRWVVQLRKDIEYGVEMVRLENLRDRSVGAGAP